MTSATLYLLLTVLNSATFSRVYMQRHGAKAMSGKQTTIQKRALLEMPVPAAVLTAPPTPLASITLDLREIEAQLAICQQVGQLLQNSSPSSVTWTRLDKLGHVATGLLYGQSLDAALADYDWWCDRAGRVPDPAPVSELVELLRSPATHCTLTGSSVD